MMVISCDKRLVRAGSYVECDLVVDDLGIGWEYFRLWECKVGDNLRVI